MREIWIVLTDDWELRGNGTGTVEGHQRRPAQRLMDLYESLGIRSTFNLEVMQQLAFERYAPEFTEIREGRDAWLAAIAEMNRRGFDTQLHIHPQWWRAEYIQGWWKLGRQWDISTYDLTDIRTMCDLAFSYLEPVIAPRKIRTFRAGSWGMGPPSRVILEELIARGIEIDVSIVSGLRYRGEGITLDYSNVDSPYQAYVPDLDDIRRLNRSGKNAAIIEIPTQSVTYWQMVARVLVALFTGDRPDQPLPIKEYLRLFRSAVWPIPRRPQPAAADRAIPDFVMRDPFGVLAGKADFGLVMDISCTYHPALVQHMSDVQIDRAGRGGGDGITVLVYENHTKDLKTDHDFDRIRRLIEHIRKRTPEVQFRTLSEVVERRKDLALCG